MLELIATVMEASFDVLGEATILGTMPAYLERFGGRNARHLARHFVRFDAARGAVSALTPLNYVSRVTDTPFEMVEATQQRATKRLMGCEFASAFERKAPFARAMICQLHRAVYQGGVNGTLKDPQTGYDVQLRSRILFGDEHCDFEVQSRSPRHYEPDTEGSAIRDANAGDASTEGHDFYTAILVAFVEYLGTVLPPKEVELLVLDCAQRVGIKTERLLRETSLDPPHSGTELVADLLTLGGRTVKVSGDVVHVTACPVGKAILDQSRALPVVQQADVRHNCCALCSGLVAGAAASGHEADVTRERCLTAGDSECRFRVRGA